jgi:translation initiation factor 3 subunit C
MTMEEMDRKVADLVASRGRKTTDTRQILRQLEVLTKVARVYGVHKEITVQMHLISSMFDYNRNIDDYMDHQQWRTCHRSLNRICRLLEANPKVILGVLNPEEVVDLQQQQQGRVALSIGGAVTATGDAAGNVVGDASGASVAASAEPLDPNVIRAVGTLESFALRLEDEYIKSLQQINPHTQVSIFII